MSKRQLSGLALLIGVIVFWVAWNVRASTPGEAQPAKAPPSEPKTHFEMVGTASCSARGCHGAFEPAGAAGPDQRVLLNEYGTWLANDPHTKAYAVLFNDQSKKITKLLNGKDSKPAHENERCLACHINPFAVQSEKRPVEQLFGVGCESCHGNATKWLIPHTTNSWANQSADFKENEGLVDVHDHAKMAARCAGCHIGAPAEKGVPLRDMNHDLIAAGHPRLTFEYSAYLANLPPHWNASFSKKQKESRKQSEADIWAIGQLASGEVALDLLRDRATRAGDKEHPSPWPEFAESDCFACHHSLKSQSWRQKQDYGGDRPGSLAWGSWYFPLVKGLAPDQRQPLEALAKEMRKPLPNASKVATEAAAIKDGLAKARTGLKVDLAKQLQSWLSDKKAPLPLTWDAAEQLFLASQCLEQPLNDQKLLKYRAFPKVPEELNSPDNDFRPSKLYEMLKTQLDLQK